MENSVTESCQESKPCTSSSAKFSELHGNMFGLEENNSHKCNDYKDNILLTNKRKFKDVNAETCPVTCDKDWKVSEYREDIVTEVLAGDDKNPTSDYNNENMKFDMDNSEQFHNNTQINALTSLPNPDHDNKEIAAADPVEDVDCDLVDMENAQSVIIRGSQDAITTDHDNQQINIDDHSEQQGHDTSNDPELILTPADCNNNYTRLPELNHHAIHAQRAETMEASEQGSVAFDDNFEEGLQSVETRQAQEIEYRLNENTTVCYNYIPTGGANDVPVTYNCIQFEMTSKEAIFPEKKNTEYFTEDRINTNITALPVPEHHAEEFVITGKHKQQIITTPNNKQEIIASNNSREESMAVQEIQQDTSYGGQGLVTLTYCKQINTSADNTNQMSLAADESNDGCVITSNNDEHKTAFDNNPKTMNSENTSHGVENLSDYDYIRNPVNVTDTSEEPVTTGIAKLEALSEHNNNHKPVVCSSSIVLGDVNAEPLTTGGNKQLNTATGNKNRKLLAMDNNEPARMARANSKQEHLIASSGNQTSNSNISGEYLYDSNNEELRANGNNNDYEQLDLGIDKPKHFITSDHVNETQIPSQNLPVSVPEPRSSCANKTGLFDTLCDQELNAVDDNSERKIYNQDVMARVSNDQQLKPTVYGANLKNNPELSRDDTNNTRNGDNTQVTVMCGHSFNNQATPTVNEEIIPGIGAQESAVTGNKEGERTSTDSEKPESMTLDESRVGDVDIDKGSDPIVTNNNADEQDIIGNNKEEYRRVGDLNLKLMTSGRESDNTEGNETWESTSEHVNKKRIAIGEGTLVTMTVSGITQDCKTNEHKYLELQLCEKQHDQSINEEETDTISDKKCEVCSKQKDICAPDDQNDEANLVGPDILLSSRDRISITAGKMAEEEKGSITASTTLDQHEQGQHSVINGVCKVHFGSPLVEYIEYTPASSDDDDDDDDTVILESEDSFWEDNSTVSDEHNTDHFTEYLSDLQKKFSECSDNEILSISPKHEELVTFKENLSFDNEEQEVPVSPYDFPDQVDFKQNVGENKYCDHRDSSNHNVIDEQPSNEDHCGVAIKYSELSTREITVCKQESNQESNCIESNSEISELTDTNDREETCSRKTVKVTDLKRKVSSARLFPSTKNFRLSTCDCDYCPSSRKEEVTAAVVPAGELANESTCVRYDGQLAADDVPEDTLFYEQSGDTSYKYNSTDLLKSSGNHYQSVEMAEKSSKNPDHAEAMVSIPTHNRIGLLRLGLSKRQRVASLHPYLKNKYKSDIS